jgi:hypothetical protein
MTQRISSRDSLVAELEANSKRWKKEKGRHISIVTLDSMRKRQYNTIL